MQRYILYAVMITSFIGALVGSGINIALPTIGQEFNAGAGDLSRVSSAYLFGAAIFTLPVGKAADILGRKKLYKIGVLFFSITLVIGGLAETVEFLSSIRFLQGGLMAMVFGPGMAVLVSVYDKSMRGKILGYSTAAVYVGLTCGPTIGGIICHYIGWRYFFYLTGLVAASGLIFLSRVKNEWYGDENAKFDFKGSFFYMVSMAMILYGMSEISEQESGIYIVFFGVIFFAMFIFQELKTQHPMLDIGLFLHNTAFSFSNLAAFLHYAATFAVSFLASLYLQIIYGLTPPEAGGILLLLFIVMAIGSPKAGAMSDKIEPGKVASVGMGINCIGLWFLSTLDGESPLLLVGGAFILIGAGFALFVSPNNNAIMSAIDYKYYGTASSLLATMRLVGQAVSMVIVTVIMDANEVKSVTGSDNDGLLAAISITYKIFSAICFLGIAASLARNKKIDGFNSADVHGGND